MVVKISEPEIKNIIKKIEIERGLDCSNFRKSYLQRRIIIRLNANNVNSVDEYLNKIESSPAEYQTLIDTLTVNVSSFFRDTEVFLKIKKIIEETINEKYKRKQRVFRVWSAGCSTGEEPYSIASIIYGAIKKLNSNWLVSVYATDVDRNCLDIARKASYPLERIIEIPRKYRDIALNLNENHFDIKPEIKKLVRFKESNLFSGNNIKFFDLILCRNVLIYFDKDEHEKLYKIFYDSLNNHGVLIIGQSEKLLHKGDRCFKPVDALKSIYQKGGVCELNNS